MTNLKLNSKKLMFTGMAALSLFGATGAVGVNMFSQPSITASAATKQVTKKVQLKYMLSKDDGSNKVGYQTVTLRANEGDKVTITSPQFKGYVKADPTVFQLKNGQFKQITPLIYSYDPSDKGSSTVTTPAKGNVGGDANSQSNSSSNKQNNANKNSSNTTKDSSNSKILNKAKHDVNTPKTKESTSTNSHGVTATQSPSNNDTDSNKSSVGNTPKTKAQKNKSNDPQTGVTQNKGIIVTAVVALMAGVSFVARKLVLNRK